MLAGLLAGIVGEVDDRFLAEVLAQKLEISLLG